MNNNINIDGKTWLKYSISVWNDIYKTKEESILDHPAIFPVEIPRRLIKIFSRKEDDVILDPFVGVGSTLIAALELGRICIGFEISDEYVKTALKRIKRYSNLFVNCDSYKIYNEDCRKLLDYVPVDSVDLCITLPPYWNILNEKRTAYDKENSNYDNFF